MNIIVRLVFDWLNQLNNHRINPIFQSFLWLIQWVFDCLPITLDGIWFIKILHLPFCFFLLLLFLAWIKKSRLFSALKITESDWLFQKFYFGCLKDAKLGGNRVQSRNKELFFLVTYPTMIRIWTIQLWTLK